MNIHHLFISPGHNYRGHHGQPAGEHPILEVSRIECIAGRGIVGDRYFDYQPDFKGQITFFEWENLERMWDELNLPSEQRDVSATRRNVIVEGLELNSLIGKEFEIQGVRFLGMEECRPCYWMNGAIHPQAEEWMKGCGGLRAKILSEGWLNADAIKRGTENFFAGCLLAGGRSLRMRSDKALLKIQDQPLWSRQISLLHSISDSVAVAAPEYPPWLPAGISWIRDADDAEGPLAGLLAALIWAQKNGASHLVALAVDLPCMNATILRSLMQACRPGVGVMPENNRCFEPLAAVYPVEAISALQDAASASRWKLQDVVTELIASGLLMSNAIEDASPFCNLNTPADLQSLS